MAVETAIVSSRLQLKYNNGVDENGNTVLETKSYANVKADADSQDIYDMANGMAGLQIKPLDSVHLIRDIALLDV